MGRQDEYAEIEIGTGPKTIRPDDIRLDALGFRILEGMAALDVRWTQLWELRLVEPCPCFEVEWRHVGGRSQRLIAPRFQSEREAVERDVLTLVEHVREHRPHVLEAGWSAFPDVEWEQVSQLPAKHAGVLQGEGAYRAARVKAEERIVATWGPPTALGSMLQWLASTPDRRWRQHPKRVVLTETYVYAERRDGTFARLPLDTLRLRRGEDDAVYVFGRKTPLVLPDIAGSTAREELDRRLSRRD